MKAKDIDIYKIFSKTFKGRKMFGFMGFGELSLMDKVDKPIRQTKDKYKELDDIFSKANKYKDQDDEDIIELPEDLVNKLNKEGKWINLLM